MRIIVLPVGRCRFLEEKRPVCGFEGTKYGGLRNVRPPIIDPHPWLKGHFSRVWFFISLRRNPPQVGVTSGQKLCIEIIYIELQASVSSQKKNNTKCRKQNSKFTWKYCRSYCWNEIDGEILPAFAQFLQSLKLIYFFEFTSLNVQDWTQVYCLLTSSNQRLWECVRCRINVWLIDDCVAWRRQFP